MRKTIVAILAGALLIGGMSGCAKRTIDKSETGSVEVPGTDGTLQKFCDGSILTVPRRSSMRSWMPGLTLSTSASATLSHITRRATRCSPPR